MRHLSEHLDKKRYGTIIIIFRVILVFTVLKCPRKKVNKFDCDQLTNTDQLSPLRALSLPFPLVNWCFKTLEALSFCSRERA